LIIPILNTKFSKKVAIGPKGKDIITLEYDLINPALNPTLGYRINTVTPLTKLFDYSNIRPIEVVSHTPFTSFTNITQVNDLALSVFPNPFQNQTTFEILNSDNQGFTLTIFNNLG
jgi:hypothetical protein